MRARPGQEMIEDYLSRLREALRSTPAERRDQIVSDVAQHIAEALAEELNPDEEIVATLLDRTGTAEEIAAALDETSGDERRHRPYGPPTVGPPASFPRPRRCQADVRRSSHEPRHRVGGPPDEEWPEGRHREGDQQRRQAHGLPTLTTSQLNSSVIDNLVMAVIFSLVSVLLWVFIARASTDGQSSARITASGLFALDTLILLIGPADLSIRGPATQPTEVFLFIVWLIGLAATVLLWQRASSEFFNASHKA